MRPLPAIDWLPPQDAVPERPWWRRGTDQVETDPHATWERAHVHVRSDGAQIYDLRTITSVDGGKKSVWWGLAHRVNGEELLYGRGPSQEGIAELLALVDGQHPLPFPGLRDGQQWFAPASHLAGCYGIAREGVFTLHAYIGVRSQHWKFGDLRLNDKEMNLLARQFFLLRDPLWPTKAPWSPT